MSNSICHWNNWLSSCQKIVTTWESINLLLYDVPCFFANIQMLAHSRRSKQSRALIWLLVIQRVPQTSFHWWTYTMLHSVNHRNMYLHLPSFGQLITGSNPKLEPLKPVIYKHSQYLLTTHYLTKSSSLPILEGTHSNLDLSVSSHTASTASAKPTDGHSISCMFFQIPHFRFS